MSKLSIIHKMNRYSFLKFWISVLRKHLSCCEFHRNTFHALEKYLFKMFKFNF